MSSKWNISVKPYPGATAADATAATWNARAGRGMRDAMDVIRAGAPRRRPDGGGYARGEETRARIIAAALRVFADEGYVRASTRQIAEAAGVTPPALQYYFDSKEGLHRACAESIVGEVWDALEPLKVGIDKAVASSDPSGALDALCDFLDGLTEFSLGEAAASWKQFIGRAQADGAGPAGAVVREEISRPIHAVVSLAVGLLLGAPAESEMAHLRASAVLGPISAFHAARANTLAILGWPDYAGERLSAVKTMLRAHTRAALGSP
jgi:AcrR family transcriptional regulator